MIGTAVGGLVAVVADDNVVPFRRRDGVKKPLPDLRVSSVAGRAPAGARDLAVQQNAAHWDAYKAAVDRQKREAEEEKLLAEGTVVPLRITMALGERYGPEVDVAVGTREGDPGGDVDAWEDPDDPRLPGAEQVRLLAAYTGFPVAFFYRQAPMAAGWITLRGPGGGRRCEPLTPARPAGQLELPGMPEPQPWIDEPAWASALESPRGDPPPRKTPPAVEQLELGRSPRMPEDLRKELEARLAARRRP